MPKILLIDDDEPFRNLVRRSLTSLGHHVIEARHGGEGLKHLKDDSIDLVITDLIMPETEGIETIMEIQRTRPGLKIIAMSGGGRFTSKDLLKMTGQLCKVPTISKPFLNRELSALISATLEPDAAIR